MFHQRATKIKVKNFFGVRTTKRNPLNELLIILNTAIGNRFGYPLNHEIFILIYTNV